MDQEVRDLGENMKEMSSLLRKLTRTVEANSKDKKNKENDDGENIPYIYENIPLKLVSKEDL